MLYNIGVLFMAGKQLLLYQRNIAFKELGSAISASNLSAAHRNIQVYPA